MPATCRLFKALKIIQTRSVYYQARVHDRAQGALAPPQTRLSGLTLLHVHRDITVDIEAAVDEFARRHPGPDASRW